MFGKMDLDVDVWVVKKFKFIESSESQSMMRYQAFPLKLSQLSFSSQRLESGTPSPTPLPSGGSARQRRQSLKHVLSCYSFYNSFGSHLDPFIFTLKVMSHIFHHFWSFFWNFWCERIMIRFKAFKPHLLINQLFL